ncbi:MAG: PHP domain-containing protein [Clostridia bacterium]
MIDLHMHTMYSDGDKTIAEILKLCEDKKLEYISITDHNTCAEYEDEYIKNNNIFCGKIIKGVEMNATFQNKKIEVLGYKIKEPKLIEEWSHKFFSEEVLREQQEESKRKLLDICDKKGLIYDESKIEKNIPVTDYITIYIYKELMRHKENYEILGEFAESLNLFIRKGLMNPESEYYTGSDNVPKPMYKDVIDVIHKAGGLAFLAHPFEYRFDDTIGFIDELRKEKELDGIECFHPSANEDEIDVLVEYAKKSNLYISGGSDYHGHKKPNVEIGVGEGNLNISKEIIEEWINQ